MIFVILNSSLLSLSFILIFVSVCVIDDIKSYFDLHKSIVEQIGESKKRFEEIKDENVDLAKKNESEIDKRKSEVIEDPETVIEIPTEKIEENKIEKNKEKKEKGKIAKNKENLAPKILTGRKREYATLSTMFEFQDSEEKEEDISDSIDSIDEDIFPINNGKPSICRYKPLYDWLIEVESLRKNDDIKNDKKLFDDLITITLEIMNLKITEKDVLKIFDVVVPNLVFYINKVENEGDITPEILTKLADVKTSWMEFIDFIVIDKKLFLIKYFILAFLDNPPAEDFDQFRWENSINPLIKMRVNMLKGKYFRRRMLELENLFSTEPYNYCEVVPCVRFVKTAIIMENNEYFYSFMSTVQSYFTLPAFPKNYTSFCSKLLKILFTRLTKSIDKSRFIHLFYDCLLPSIMIHDQQTKEKLRKHVKKSVIDKLRPSIDKFLCLKIENNILLSEILPPYLETQKFSISDILQFSNTRPQLINLNDLVVTKNVLREENYLPLAMRNPYNYYRLLCWIERELAKIEKISLDKLEKGVSTDCKEDLRILVIIRQGKIPNEIENGESDE